MEVHILFPANGKKGIEIRVVGLGEDQNVQVKEQKYILPAEETKKEENTEPRWDEDNTICPSCGKKLIQPVTGRKRRFCNEDCRRTWWNENRDKTNKSPDAIYTFICKNCGKEFTSYANKKRIYCSRECCLADKYWGGALPEVNETDYSTTPKVTLLEN